jgi:hypothetical protein
MIQRGDWEKREGVGEVLISVPLTIARLERIERLTQATASMLSHKFIDTTGTSLGASGVNSREERNQENKKNWIPVCAAMTKAIPCAKQFLDSVLAQFLQGVDPIGGGRMRG